jgi:hypothetical protein
VRKPLKQSSHVSQDSVIVRKLFQSESRGTPYIYSETEVECEPNNDDWSPGTRNLGDSQRLDDEQDYENGTADADNGAGGDVGAGNLEALDSAEDRLGWSKETISHDQTNTKHGKHFE